MLQLQHASMKQFYFIAFAIRFQGGGATKLELGVPLDGLNLNEYAASISSAIEQYKQIPAFELPKRYDSGSNPVDSKIIFAIFCRSVIPTMAYDASSW